jgi:hypothetical protein
MEKSNLNPGAPGPMSAETQANSEFDQIQSEIGGGDNPGDSAANPEKPAMPTINLVRPALVMVCKTAFPGKTVADSDIEQCAQAYADLLDYYFPGGVLGHPAFVAALLTSNLYMKYHEPKPEKTPEGQASNASAVPA